MANQDDDEKVSFPSRRDAVEEAVEREINRRRRLLLTFIILLLIPVGVGVVFLSYGRSDRSFVTREVRQEFAPLQDRLNTTEKATSDLDGALSAANSKIQLTQEQARLAAQVAAAARRDSATMSNTLKSEIATKANFTDVNLLGNKFSVVREDVQSLDNKVGGVRTELDVTRQDLQMARSELGSLVERNHAEVEQLRRLGERDYIEFAISSGKKVQKVGPTLVALRDINRKRNRFSAVVEVNDKQLELDNRSVDEVIYLHLVGSMRPAELVVTQLSEDKIVGYLSMPKLQN